MRRTERTAASAGVAPLAVAALLVVAWPARAQDIEPRAYSNAPVGMNFVIAGIAGTRGALPFDPSVPITDAELRTTSGVFAYARVLDLWGMAGKFDAIVPFVDLSGTALYRGDPVSREVSGLGDTRLRLSVNFVGAPALTLREFGAYQQDLIVGASLQVTAPTGQYDSTRLVNIGSHRWAFKPEIGVSKTAGRWTLEGQAAVTLFTDNTDFFDGGTRAQEPLVSLQGHAIYGFASGVWASLDGTWFGGGRTTLNGALSGDLQQNWRLGATLALPVDKHQSLKFYASSGVSARTGNNFDLLGAAWQVRWGGGL